MDIQTTYLVEVFKGMMPYIQAQYDSVNDPVETPYFLYGRKKEIMQILTEKDKDDTYKYKKYPCIILYHSQPERHGNVGIATNYLVNPLVSIVTDSNKDFRTYDTDTGVNNDRYRNTVQTILYPIYNYLIQEISDNPAFYQSYPDEIQNQITVWDGSPQTDSGIIVNDYLDGIDIQFTDLRLFKNTPNCVSA